MINTFVTLTENDRRLIIVLLLVFILVFIIVGFLVDLIRRMMRYQGKRIDQAMGTLVESGLIRSPKMFSQIAHQKNRIFLFKQFTAPFLILLFAGIIYLTYSSIIASINSQPFRFIDLFDYDKEGFATLLYIFDWKNQPFTSIFGIRVASDWPPVLSHPHFEWEALMSYIIVPAFFVGIVYLLIVVQAFIARFIRIGTLKKALFTRNLAETKLNDLSAIDDYKAGKTP